MAIVPENGWRTIDRAATFAAALRASLPRSTWRRPCAWYQSPATGVLSWPGRIMAAGCWIRLPATLRRVSDVRVAD